MGKCRYARIAYPRNKLHCCTFTTTLTSNELATQTHSASVIMSNFGPFWQFLGISHFIPPRVRPCLLRTFTRCSESILCIGLYNTEGITLEC